MKNAFQLAWGIMQGLFYRWKYRNRVRATAVEEVPESLDRRHLYLIGSENPWSAALLCPCGCGEILHLSLLLDDSPSWTLHMEKRSKLPTLSPSVWRTKGCRSHFFLRDGLIDWCRLSLVQSTVKD
jgi:hypothetical protein